MPGLSRAACSRRGISARQGLHQVAQKFRTTGLPRCAVRRVVSPEGWTQTKSGAFAPTRPAVSGASTTLVMTPTFVCPTNARCCSCGATRAAMEASAMIVTNSAAIHRGSWSRLSSARGAGTTLSPFFRAGSPLEQRQEVEELVQPRELAREEQQAHDDDQRTADRVHRPDVRAHPVEGPAHASEPARDEEERHAEPERIGEEQHRAGGEVGVEEDGEDEGQVRPDARRPPRAEGDADEERAPVARRGALEAQVRRALEERDGDEPEHVHPEDDEGDAGDPLEPVDERGPEAPEQRD